jgi:YVTN family beta-propeller protein
MKRFAIAGAVVAAAAVTAGSASAAPPNVHNITVGSNPAAVAISQPNGQAYVANDGSVSVIDLKTKTQTAEIGTGVNHGQTAIGVFKNGKKVYIGGLTLSKFVVFNPATQKVSKPQSLGPGATDIVSGRPGFAYFSMSQHDGTRGWVKVVNTSTQKVVAAIFFPHAGIQVLRAHGRFLWAGSIQGGRIFVIDMRTNRVVRSIVVPKAGPMQGIAFSNDGKEAWTIGIAGLAVVNRSTGKTVKSIGTTTLFPSSQGPFPSGIALNKAGTSALALDSAAFATPSAGSVTVINTSTVKITENIPVGNLPLALGLDYRRGITYVPNFNDDTLSYFRTP